jgi:hypothetical protein
MPLQTILSQQQMANGETRACREKYNARFNMRC